MSRSAKASSRARDASADGGAGLPSGIIREISVAPRRPRAAGVIPGTAWTGRATIRGHPPTPLTTAAGCRNRHPAATPSRPQPPLHPAHTVGVAVGAGPSGLPCHTTPPRGPLAQLGARRPCTARPSHEPPFRTQETKRRTATPAAIRPQSTLQPATCARCFVASVSSVACRTVRGDRRTLQGSRSSSSRLCSIGLPPIWLRAFRWVAGETTPDSRSKSR